MMDKYNHWTSIQDLMEHILSQSEKFWWITDINWYLWKFLSKFITTRLELAWSFDNINWEKWQDICRNITLFWEEVDLWQMIPMNDDWIYTNPNYVLDHYKYSLDGIFKWFQCFIETLEKHTNYQIDHAQLSESIYDIIVDWLKDNIDVQREYYNKYWWCKLYGNIDSGLNQHLNILFKKCFSSFLNYIPQQKYQEILRDKLENIIKKPRN
jgi:hypothetical protein